MRLLQMKELIRIATLRSFTYAFFVRRSRSSSEMTWARVIDSVVCSKVADNDHPLRVMTRVISNS